MKQAPKYSAAAALLLLMLAACTAKLPADYKQLAALPAIFPDNIDVTIPANIAPLTFYIDDEADDYVTSLSAGDRQMVLGGRSVCPPPKEWRQLMQAAAGGSVTVQVYARRAGEWQAFTPFLYHVAADEIDPYISYRQIAPSYVTYEELTINQRNITNYDESEIYNNMLVSTEVNGQCINCHSYKNYKTDNMQFHIRQYQGGTMLVTDGKVKKVNLKTDSTLSAGVYPSFNPCYNVIAYSVNNTGQSFHTRHPNKIEVQDMASDLILYDYDNNEVSIVQALPDEFEVFPWWSPDGCTLYYCSAHFERKDTAANIDKETILRYKEFHYNVYSRSYNPQSKTFGPARMVINADSLGLSATLPRISPDGRYLLVGMAEYGVFHIWHKDADLYVLDLATDSLYNLAAANSDDVESYHSWSSNGRWILFASRRDDGGFTRLYASYFDSDGQPRKPFEIPQSDPLYYRNFYKSYNVPEFMIEPVRITPHQFAEYDKQPALNARFVER